MKNYSFKRLSFLSNYDDRVEHKLGASFFLYLVNFSQDQRNTNYSSYTSNIHDSKAIKKEYIRRDPLIKKFVLNFKRRIFSIAFLLFPYFYLLFIINISKYIKKKKIKFVTAKIIWYHKLENWILTSCVYLVSILRENNHNVNFSFILDLKESMNLNSWYI